MADDDIDLDTAKAKFRQLAAEYPPTPAGLQALVADPRLLAVFPSRPVEVSLARDGLVVTVQVPHG